MSSSINVLLVLVGFFLVAVLLNMYMFHEGFSSSFKVTTTTVVTDLNGNLVGDTSVSDSASASDSASDSENPVTKDASGKSLSVDNSGDSVGDSVGDQMVNSGDASSNVTLDPNGNPVVTSGNPAMDSENSPGLEQGNTFSKLIQKLISGTSAKVTATASVNGDKTKPSTVNSGKSFDITPDGQNKDILNYSLDAGAQQPTLLDATAPTADATTPFLQQGADYSGTGGINQASSAYAVGQQTARKAAPCPVDLNEYIRKDSIPCYGCTLK